MRLRVTADSIAKLRRWLGEIWSTTHQPSERSEPDAKFEMTKEEDGSNFMPGGQNAF